MQKFVLSSFSALYFNFFVINNTTVIVKNIVFSKIQNEYQIFNQICRKNVPRLNRRN